VVIFEGKVTVPHPRKELDPKTVKNIFKQAGLNMLEGRNKNG
jgi:predicted RNA binding protein YcfA (HicA-like mRNA interferase family)